MVRPWSPVWVVAAIATSSTRSGGSWGFRLTSSRMQRITRSSARVSAYMPPALPNGVRTPSTKTTSRLTRGTTSLLAGGDFMLLAGNIVAYPAPALKLCEREIKFTRSPGDRAEEQDQIPVVPGCMVLAVAPAETGRCAPCQVRDHSPSPAQRAPPATPPPHAPAR